MGSTALQPGEADGQDEAASKQVTAAAAAAATHRRRSESGAAQEFSFTPPSRWQGTRVQLPAPRPPVRSAGSSHPPTPSGRTSSADSGGVTLRCSVLSSGGGGTSMVAVVVEYILLPLLQQGNWRGQQQRAQRCAHRARARAWIAASCSAAAAAAAARSIRQWRCPRRWWSESASLYSPRPPAWPAARRTSAGCRRCGPGCTRTACPAARPTSPCRVSQRASCRTAQPGGMWALGGG